MPGEQPPRKACRKAEWGNASLRKRPQEPNGTGTTLRDSQVQEKKLDVGTTSGEQTRSGSMKRPGSR